MAEWLDDFLFTYETLIHALGVNGLLALSMYCVMAVGQLSLGQAAFMGIGAYTGALLTLNLGLPFWLVLPLSALAPAVVALVIGGPTLRLSGVYLAIATIALGEVLRVLYINAEWLTGGALGLSGIPRKADLWLIYLLLFLAILGVLGGRPLEDRPRHGGHARGRGGRRRHGRQPAASTRWARWSSRRCWRDLPAA